jgi:endonuclease YncB( thermonuclease family)
MMTKAQRTILLLTVLFLIVLSSQSLATKTSVTAKVMKVTDGDTVIIGPREGGLFFKCRLYGIDAPETRPPQPFGEEASRELRSLILGQTVEVKLTGQKTHSREVLGCSP